MTNRLDQQEIMTKIEEMRSNMRFPSFQAPSNISTIINEINTSNLYMLDATKLYDYAAKLASYSLYVRKELNAWKAKRDWCESNIKHIVGVKAREIDGYFTEKELIIRSNDENAKELDAISLECGAKINILYGIDENMRFLSNMIINIAKEKSFARRNEV